MVRVELEKDGLHVLTASFADYPQVGDNLDIGGVIYRVEARCMVATTDEFWVSVRVLR